ncbi:MAG: hypothetical protein P4L33_17145 [Capsulimonadaceae bacterium]|nr:hypothetical protein [Capsulimonadaceae bacterium]
MGLLYSTPEPRRGHAGLGPGSALAKPEPAGERGLRLRLSGRRGSAVPVVLGLVAVALLTASIMGASPARASDADTSGGDVTAESVVDLDVTNANMLAVIELLRRPGGTQFIISGDTKLFRPVTVHLTAKLSKMLEYVAASAGAKITKDEYGVYTIAPIDPNAPEPAAAPKVSTGTDLHLVAPVQPAEPAPQADDTPRHWESVNLTYVEPSFVLSILNVPERQISSPYGSDRQPTGQPFAPPNNQGPVILDPIMGASHISTSGASATSQGQGGVPVSGGGSDTGLAPGRATTTLGAIAQQFAPGGAAPGGAGGAGGAAAPKVDLRPAGVDQIIAITEQNTLLVRGTSQGISELRDIISKLDVPARQVQIKVEFVTASVDDIDELGMTYDLIPFPNLAVGWTSPGGTGTGSTSLTYSYGNVAAQLQALLQTSKGKLITAPMITLTNNIQGSVYVTEQIPYTNSTTTTSSSSTLSSTSTQYVSVPTGLTARARINGDDTVTLQLTPQVSSVGASDSNGAPTVSSQNVQTIRTVGNGETLVLGGLVQKTDTNSRYSIPLLSNLPVIGSMFRSRNNSRTDSELLLFVTPTILPVPGSTTTGERPAPTDQGAAVQVGVSP